METEDRNIVSSALHGGNPLKSYIKTILGKVYVTVWDSFENVPEGVILQGDPRKGDDTCVVNIWSEEEDYYFRNKNKRHFQTGNIKEFTKKDEKKERPIEEYSDEELVNVINSKNFAFQKILNSIDTIAVLFRIKSLAEELEKSEKLMKAIEARISEVQAQEYKAMPSVLNTEL